jgi:hypothetical protein
VAVKEPEFAHILAEVAEHVLSSFGRLMASPDAARHVYNALFYYFEGYQTRDGEVLFARIERTVREAVKKAEEAGIPDAEYRIKQFVLEVIDVLARAGERYRRDALRGVLTVEKALRASALAGFSAAALYSVYSGLYSEAVVSSVASAVALAEVGQFKEAVQYVQKAAKALYEAAKDVFERVKVTVQRLVELFIEAVTRVLAWIDEHKAYLFLMAAVTAGAITLSAALNIWGLIELEKLAYAAVGMPPFVAGLADARGRAAERFGAVAKRWKVSEDEKKQKIEGIIKEITNAPLRGETSQSSRRPYEALQELTEPANLPKLHEELGEALTEPLVKLRKALARVKDEVERDAAVVAALVLYKTLVKNAEAYGEWAELFDVRAYIGEGRYYYIVASGKNAARFERLLAVSAPSAGGEYLSPKFDEFVEAAKVEVRVDNIRQTEKGHVAADLIISEAGVAVKYNVYLSENAIELQFRSTDRGRIELAARLLRHAGVGAEIKRRGDGDGWYVVATTDALAAGREELRKALAEIVKTARKSVGEEKAKRWLEKLERGVVAWEGKKFEMRLAKGALVVHFRSTSRESVEEVAREFKAMGLEEDVHFTVKWSGERGHVYLLAEGVRRLAWVSVHGEEGQRKRAAEFLKFLEERAKAKGAEVLRKLEALVEEGRSRGVLRLVGLEKDGVKVLDVKTEEKDDKLYVTIKAEVDGAAGEYKITLYRGKDGKRYLHFYVRGEEAVTRAVKLIEVLTGERPQVTEMPNGWTRIRGFGSHVDAMARYEELRETIERWSNR